MLTTVRCPNCQTPVEWSARSPFRPFCSRRCKLIDLGEWLDEGRAIPGSPLDDDLSDIVSDSSDPANDGH